MNKILSPITGSSNTKIVDSISVDIIREAYKRLDIDLSSSYSRIEEVLICECRESGLLFYYPRNLAGDENFYDKLKAHILQHNLQYYPENKWEYERCTNLIEPNESVYEIGAGNGAFLRKLIKKGCFNVTGSELNMASILEAKNLGVNLEYITIEEKAKTHENYYDVVCSFQVLEHVTDVKSFIKSAIMILKPGGKLLFVVPFNNPYFLRNDKFHTLNMPPHHMELWNERSLRSLPKFFNLMLEKIEIESLQYPSDEFNLYYFVNLQIETKYLLINKILNSISYRILKIIHKKINGRNILSIYRKKNIYS